MSYTKHLSLLLWLVGIALPAQVSFKAVPDKTTAKVGEKIQLSYIITTSDDVDLGEISYPRFADFQMIGRNIGQSYSYSKGKTTKQYMETVILVPQRAGNITVQGGTVIVNGEKIKSNPVTFQITKAAERKTNEGSQLVYMQVNLTEQEAYPNQSILAEVKLYAKSFEALRRRSDLEVPGMSDFQVTEVSKNQERDFHQESINNQVFISEKIAVYQLQPSATGILEVPSFSIRVAIPIGFFDEKIVEVKSEPVSLKVKDFPPNAPANFAGAVGDFKFATYATPTDLNINKSLNYEIELVGEGNFSSIRLPKIKVPEELELYPPKTRNAYKTTASGEKGKLVNSYVIVPQYGGDYEIPAIEFSYFNADQGEYKTIATDPITVHVEGKSREEILVENAKEQDSLYLSETDTADRIKSIIPELPNEITQIFKTQPDQVDSPQTESPSEPANSQWMYYMGLVPVLAGLLWFFIFRNRNKDNDDIATENFSELEFKTQMKANLAQLKDAEQANDLNAFYIQSNKLLNDIVSFVAKEDRIYDVVSARRILSGKKSDTFADKWEQMYNQIQMMKYGVVSSDMELTECYHTIKGFIKELLK